MYLVRWQYFRDMTRFAPRRRTCSRQRNQSAAMASQLNTRAIDMLPNQKPRHPLINCAGKIITGGVGRWYLMVLNGVKEVRAASRAAAARQRRSSGSATLRTQREAAPARFGKAARWVSGRVMYPPRQLYVEKRGRRST
jgi:hypothetical protein